MPYTKTTWVNGVTPANATNLNNLETQYTESTLSFNPDLFTSGFVVSGYTAAKDGVTANLLDVAAGNAYLVQADGTTRQRKLGASTQTTATINSTYHLYLQPDGTWYWSTSNAPATNSLHICDVATDASGNISTVTDTRVTSPTLFPNIGDHIGVPHGFNLNPVALNGEAVNTVQLYALAGAAGQADLQIRSINGGHIYLVGKNAFIDIDQNANIGIPGHVTNLNGQATAGNFGVPPIVAQAYGVAVSATTTQTILQYTPGANGLYRISGAITKQNTTSNQLIMQISYTDPFSGVQGQGAYFQVADTLGSFDVLSGGTGDTAFGAKTLALMSITFHAKAAFPITVTYQDPSGTPNDNVSVVVERLI